MSDTARETAATAAPDRAAIEQPRPVLGIGTVLARVFTIFVMRFPKVMILTLPAGALIGLIFYGGIYWIDSWLLGRLNGLPGWLFNPFTVFSTALGCGMGLAAGPLSAGFDHYWRTGTLPVWKSFGRVWARPLVALLIGVLVMAATLLPFAALSWATSARLGLAIGCAALIVGMYAMGLWGLALPSIAMDRIGLRGLKRSFHLGQGYRWQIAGTCFVLFFAAILVGSLVGAGLILLGRVVLVEWLELRDFDTFAPGVDLFELLAFVDFCLAYTIVVALITLGLAAIRARMVEIKEPPDIGDMVAVFD